MVILLKLLIIFAVVGTLRTSARFRHMSRELDEAAMSSLKQMMHSAEESGFPPELIPLLILLTALCFMLSTAFTLPGVR